MELRCDRRGGQDRPLSGGRCRHARSSG